MIIRKYIWIWPFLTINSTFDCFYIAFKYWTILYQHTYKCWFIPQNIHTASKEDIPSPTPPPSDILVHLVIKLFVWIFSFGTIYPPPQASLWVESACKFGLKKTLAIFPVHLIPWKIGNAHRGSYFWYTFT
jgi:hypothetical protein